MQTRWVLIALVVSVAACGGDRRSSQATDSSGDGSETDGTEPRDLGEDGADVAADGADVPVDGADVAADGADVPVGGADVAADGADVAEDGSDVAEGGADVTEDGTDVAGDGAGDARDAIGEAADTASSDRDDGAEDTPFDLGGPTSVILTTFDRGVQVNATFVAFRDGDDPWQVADGLGGGYTLTVESGRYGLAVVCHEGLSDFVRIRALDALVSEAPAPKEYCTQTVPSLSVSGTVTGLVADDDVQISFGDWYTVASLDAPTFSLMARPGGLDVAMNRRDATGTTLQILLRRQLPISDGASYTFDFASDGFSPQTQAIAVEGLLEGEPLVYLEHFTTHGGTALFLAPATDTWPGVPEEFLFGNDIHSVGVLTGEFALGTRRGSMRFLRAPADVVLTLPAPAPATTVTVASATPNVRLRASVSRVSGTQLYSLLAFPVPSASVFWTAEVTDGWLEASGTSLVEMPDVAELPGWDDAWNYESGEQLAWFLDAVASNREAGDIIQAIHSEVPVEGLDGLELDTATRYGEILP